jgi:hypothetical protein
VKLPSLTKHYRTSLAKNIKSCKALLPLYKRPLDLYSIEKVASLKTTTPFHVILDTAVYDVPRCFHYMRKFDRLCPDFEGRYA